MKQTVGLVGWRGIVGSVLINRMIEENDFENINPVFFSTSQYGSVSPNIPGINKSTLQNAYDIDQLKSMDIILTCQGSEYTDLVYHKLRSSGWSGYWIDAASSLRMNNISTIVLDPINIECIQLSIQKGIKTFIGGNCTVSLMLMALGGLFFKKLIDWVTFSTYQAASGAGSKNVIELLNQMGYLYNSVSFDINNPLISILDIDKKASSALQDTAFPKKHFLSPLAGNVLPWIDHEYKNGQTKEEWKVQSEANKILGLNNTIPIDGTCVRVGTLRCHSQSFVIKLKKYISCQNIISILQEHNSWVKVVPNDSQSTLQLLTPANVSGTLDILIGRIRKLSMGSKFLTIFTVGDQLLWGAAEPLRRMLLILISNVC